jgi:Helix-destabilising protein
MIRIEIASVSVTEKPKTWTDRKGKQQSNIFREQMGFAFLVNADGVVDPHPTKIIITLDSEAPAFPVGMYVLDPRSLYVNGFSNLTFGRLRLKLVDTGRAVKAA